MHLFRKRPILAPLATLLFCATAFAADLSIQPGDQLIRVDLQNQQQLAQLLNMDLDIWSHELGVGPIDVHVSAAQRQQIQNAGLAFTLLNADLSAERAREIAETVAPRAPGDFTAYKDLDGIIAYINQLAAARPDLCTLSTFGASVEGRPLYVLKITGPNPGPKPAVFYHGLIHAREWITGPAVMFIAEYLVNNYDSDPCVADLVNRMEFYLAPCVNPDGYAYTWGPQRLWRKNRRNNGGGSFGVDLNRNFDYHWGEAGSSASTTSETYRGPSPFSEPETQAIRDFIVAHPNIKAYMDHHSYSQMLLWPWGYTPLLCPDEPTFSAVGDFMQSLIIGTHGVPYVAGPINTTIYAASGGSVDWVYGAGASLRLAYTTELRPAAGAPDGFLLPAEQILPACEENLASILYLSRWASSGVLLDLPSTFPTSLVAGRTTLLSVNLTGAQEAVVPASALIYFRFNPNDQFMTTPLTWQNGTAYSGTIPAGTCGQTLEFYFAASGTGGGQALLPCGAPSTVYALPIGMPETPEPVYSFTLDSNPGWLLGTSWTFGTPQGTCGDPVSAYTGPNVYGYRFSACYQNSLSASRYLTTTAINCAGLSNVRLQFRRWLGIEAAIYDHADIQASSDGSNWTTVWNHTGETLVESAWSLQTVDLSSVADGEPTVFVRWGLGPTDGGSGFAGWNIDDIEILGSPAFDCGAVMPGDVSGNALLDGRDLPAFVAVLLDPESATTTETCAADVNQSCGVTTEDVAPFVALLLE